MKEYLIGKNEAGGRLDKFVFKVLKEAPSSFVYKMMRKKNIVLNDKKCEGRELLCEGDTIKIYLSDETFLKFSGKESKKAEAYPYIPLDIVYEDENMVFVNKPAGMLSQKAEATDISINEYIIGYLLKNGSVTAESLEMFTPSVCNRLDRNTSGLILAGKTLPGSRFLSEILKSREIKKYYIAVVYGCVREDMKLCGYLVKNEKTNKVTVSDKSDGNDEEKYIETEYTVLKSCVDYSVLKIHLLTGRPHQIRAHLASIGHAIIGDPKYGNSNVNQKFGKNKQLLHAYMVVLPDGRSFTAKLPTCFSEFTDSIKGM